MATPIVIDVVVGISSPIGLAFRGNELFIAEWGAGKISKILDVTANIAEVIEVVTGLNLPTKLAFKGNALYFSLDSDGKISKIDDVTTSETVISDVVTGLTNPVGIVFKGNDLFITEPMNNTSEDKIYKIDTTNENPILREVLTGVNGPRGLVFSGDLLFIAEASAGRVSVFNAATLGVKLFDKNNEVITIFPNPTSNTLFISGNETPIAVAIFNVLGKEVLSIKNTNNINVQALQSGVYVIRISDGVGQTNRKFIKN